MKKRIAWLVALAGAVVIGSLAITSPLVQNLLYTGHRTGGSDRAQGTYELQGEDLTLKEPVFGGQDLTGIRSSGLHLLFDIAEDQVAWFDSFFVCYCVQEPLVQCFI